MLHEHGGTAHLSNAGGLTARGNAQNCLIRLFVDRICPFFPWYKHGLVMMLSGPHCSQKVPKNQPMPGMKLGKYQIMIPPDMDQHDRQKSSPFL